MKVTYWGTILNDATNVAHRKLKRAYKHMPLDCLRCKGLFPVRQENLPPTAEWTGLQEGFRGLKIH